MTSLTGEKFDLWKTGWSTFVRIPRDRPVADLVVRGNVNAYEEEACAPAYLREVEVSGAWLQDSMVFLRAGSLESSTPFAVSVNGSSFKEITDVRGTEFASNSAFALHGEIINEDAEEWGPDAKVLLQMGERELEVRQHTEGRGEDSRAMLDLSVAGLDGLTETVGGWLGLDGASDAGSPPDRCLSLESTVPVHSMAAKLPGFRSPQRK